MSINLLHHTKFIAPATCVISIITDVPAMSCTPKQILHSGFYLRGPNFCKICKVLTRSQILILKLLFYFRQPATEHSPKLSQKNIYSLQIPDIRCGYPSTYGMCPTTVVPLHVAMARDHGNFVYHSDKPVFLPLHLTMHTSS